jgi:hypothetical protein
MLVQGIRLLSLLAVAAIWSPRPARAQTALPFKDIIFVERGILAANASNTWMHDEYNGFHFCDEYFGHNGKTGGGLFMLKNFQSSNPTKVDIVAGLKVPAGKTNAGQLLSTGTFLSPDLSYDGKTIVFAWSSGGTEKWTAKNRFHLFKVDIDGKNLVQLTDGDFDDFQPSWMPNGRIVFISTRRGGFGRCHGRPVPTYTLHSVKSDGSDIIRLSEHETNEFHPSIANDGRIVYMRWDYIDRDAKAAHHIWFCNPDGTNPRSWGGNYSIPLETITRNPPYDDGRLNGKRPQSEFYPRAIPGSKTKYVAVAGPHHGEAFGTLMIRDFSVKDDNQMGQVTKITPEVGFPETADNGAYGGPYGPAWPLSETEFLTSYNNELVLIDTSVKPTKRTTYYKTNDPALRPLYAMPVAPRDKPPVIAETTNQGERYYQGAPPATVQVANVYTTDEFGKLPSGVKIKSMRIVQVLSKSTPNANDPRLGFSSQNVPKLSLGTVPVEEDGSVFFEGPIGKLILFQLLDENGMAVQTMRSATYLHPSENLTCTGCHEDKMEAPPVTGTPMASGRPASKMEPELGRVEPMNYARYIAPILRDKCFSCHKEKNAGPTDATYNGDRTNPKALWNYVFWFAGDADGNLEAVHGGSRSKAGMIGARGSRMGKALLNDTHKKALADGKFTKTDVLTLTQWLDLGSDELGSCSDQNAQRRGELVYPALDFDKNDPQGLKYKLENPNLLPRPDAGVDTRPADAASAGGSGGTVATGGRSGGTGGTAAGGTGGSGGKGSGGVSSGGSSGGASGGQAGNKGSGGSGGSGGSDGRNSTGGSRAVGGSSSGGCSFAAHSGAPAHLGFLFIVGIALLARKRRR